MKDRFTTVKKAVCYVLGILIIAIGINFSRRCGMGISPVSSLPGVLENVVGWTLGAWTIIVYCVLVLLQIVVLGKNFRLKGLLGIVLAVGFGFVVDLFRIKQEAQFFGLDISAIGAWLKWLPAPENYLAQLGYCALGMIIIAIGVFLYVRVGWVAMPAEGLAAAIAERSGKKFGDCKTLVDVSMILSALIIQIIFMGFSCFTDGTAIVREGTIFAAVLVGQLVKLISKFFGKKYDKFLGKE